MNLIETKTSLAESLEDAGWPVKTYVPTNVQPPLVIMVPAEPYIEDADTFGGDTLTVNLDVYVLPKVGANSRESADLDRMLEALIPRFGDWAIEVGRPELYTLQQNLYYGARVATSHPFTISA